MEFDARYVRPSEVDLLLGDAAKARKKLGWHPATSFESLVRIMVESDWHLARCEQHLAGHRLAA